MESYEVEEQKISPFDEVGQLMKDIGFWNQYEGLILLMMGDVSLVLDHLGKKNFCPIEVINVVKTVLRLISMSEKKFKELMANPNELKEYVKMIAISFISPIINYMRKGLKVRTR